MFCSLYGRRERKSLLIRILKLDAKPGDNVNIPDVLEPL